MSDRLGEVFLRKDNCCLDIVISFVFVTVLMDSGTKISERPMMKMEYTSYSDLLHIVYGRSGNISWADAELQIPDCKICNFKKILVEIFAEYCRTEIII